MTEELEKYILEHIDKEDDCLYDLYRATNVHLLYGRMASGHLQGRLLKMLVEIAKPVNIVEIGTFSGYSAICMAQGLLSLRNEELGIRNEELGGPSQVPNPESRIPNLTPRIPHRLYTFEINDELEDFTRGWIEKSGLADLIDFRIGDALTEIPKLGIKFDFAFMDGDKRKYPEYYEMLMGVMNVGGLIVADNTLWDGHVVEQVARSKEQVAGSKEQGAGSKEQVAGSKEQGEGSKEQGEGSKEQVAGSKEKVAVGGQQSFDGIRNKDQQTVGIQRFNDIVAADDRVEKVILPLRDGLTLIKINKTTN